MRVAISIAEHEQEMADRWLSWICELGGTDGHSLWIIPSANVKMSNLFPRAEKAFGGNIALIKDEEGETSDWQVTEAMRSAAGPNSSFRQIAWDAYMNKRGPYFWCELDCIPMRRDWLDKLEAEYKACGKPFMGANVKIESVPEHMSGNAIYPTNIPEVAPTLVKRTDWIPKGQERAFELAFDIAGAREVLPQAHFTNLIQHKFRFKGFDSRYEFDAVIDKNAVVFHSDKKGTIFKYLRENLSGSSTLERQEPDAVIGGASNVGLESPPAQESHLAWNWRRTEHGVEPDIKVGVAKAREGSPWESMTQMDCPARPIQSDPHPPTVESRTFKPTEEVESVIVPPAIPKPWENREDSERDIKMLCDTLSIYCKTPVFKGRVRKALREAKIIK